MNKEVTNTVQTLTINIMVGSAPNLLTVLTKTSNDLPV